MLWIVNFGADDSKYSVLFYIGLEGKGELELAAEEDSEVSNFWCFVPTFLKLAIFLDLNRSSLIPCTFCQGLNGPVKIEGDTPDLGEFSLHIVDGTHNVHPESITSLTDLARTQYWGTNIPAGQVWRA